MTNNKTRKFAEEGAKVALEIGAVTTHIGFHIEALFVSAFVLAGGFLYHTNNQENLIQIVGGLI